MTSAEQPNCPFRLPCRDVSPIKGGAKRTRFDVMRLDAEIDYAMRSLLAMAIIGERLTISEVAEIFGLQRHTLMRSFLTLRAMGLIHTQRGTNGGSVLVVAPEQITMDKLIRAIEPAYILAPCMGKKSCKVLPDCLYRHTLFDALRLFHERMAQLTIKDLAEDPGTRAPIVEAAKELGLLDEDFH